jgi:hypothetical protein
MRATYCKHCGQRLGNEDLICVRCGQLVPQEEFESDARVRQTEATVGVYQGASSLARVDDEPSAQQTLDPEQSSSASEQWQYNSVPATPRSVPRRRSSFPVVEVLVAVLLLVGAGASLWIFRSTLPKRQAEPPPIIVTIDPPSAHVRVGKTADFAAAVSGAPNHDVIWSVREGDAGGRVAAKGAKAGDGNVSSLATYTAPKKPGTYHVLATSNTTPASAVSAEITVVRK